MSEIVLGIESSSDRGSVALCQDGALVAQAATTEPNRHAESLLPLTEQILAQTGLAKHDLCAIVVGTGPGSYTGLRVGLSLATGMGLGLSIPVLGVSSLVVLASSLIRHADTTTLISRPRAYAALLDARRGESFFAAFDADLEALVEPCVLPNEGVASFVARHLPAYDVIVAGQAATGLLAVELLPTPELRELTELAFPTAFAATLLAKSKHAVADPLPAYLRDADAKLPALPRNPLSGVD